MILDPKHDTIPERDYFVVFSIRTGRPLFTLEARPDDVPGREVVCVRAVDGRRATLAAQRLRQG
jgi:hypothetical protein